ncbi:hypothetical protein H0A64_07055 [Alcaligenaceae bacterium]|nr:hypothetical protein [Alcaligenaceae bacterium]
MNLRTLSDSEFLRHAYAQSDDLTSSDIERELLRRFELVDTDAYEAVQEVELCAADLRQLGEALEGFTVSEVAELLGLLLEANIDAKALTAILRLLEKAGITESDEFEAELKLADEFRKLANDAGDVLTRLTTLITETQED